MPRQRLAPAVALALVGTVLGLLTGCGGNAPATYNDADVTFASEMVTHHEQAVALVELVDRHRVDPAVRSLAAAVRQSQQPEIEVLTGRLEAWDKPTPGAAGAGGTDMSMGGSRDGMVSEREMHRLADAPDSTFEQQWLTLMIQHHEGTLAMARTEVDAGRNPDVVALARRAVDTQGDQVDQMRALLAALAS